MSRFTWLSLIVTVVGPLTHATAGSQETKSVYLRAMGREGNRIFFVTETADLKTLRRFEAAETAKVSLYFPKPPFGKMEPKSVPFRRFVALYMRKDKKPPQPAALSGLFTITLRRQRITAFEQRLP